MTSHTNQRLDWVDYAKGICIFAVVCLYSTKVAADYVGSAGWLQYWAEFAAPFRMPDFFLLSGLFLSRVINRPWKGYFDKKVVHYLYFFGLWTFINLVILFAVGEIKGGAMTFVSEFWSKLSSWPYKMLWFIQMLPAYFLFTRLTLRLPVWLVFAVAALLQAFPLFHTGRAIIDEFWSRYVFFFAGYVGAPLFFKLADWVQKNMLLSLLGLLLWVIVNGTLVNLGYADKPFVGLALGLVGATAIITFGALAAKFRFAYWLCYLGKNSIVVYLAFYWPMIIAATLMSKNSWFTSDHGTFALLITALGILGALLLFWSIGQNKLGRWLFTRPTWAFLPGYKAPQSLKREGV